MSPNRLADQTSPYLRQHADNPVDWYPWGPEAFAAAQGRDVPILLSIGYSACHWCHVMAHESFESPAVARVVNDSFVCVKVDREERPDVDAVYMEAVQATTGRGGWPMTVFLLPDGRPFLAGTYFPPTSRGGMPGFTDLCAAVTDAWHTRRDDVVAQAATIADAVRARTTLPQPDGTPAAPGAALGAAYAALRRIHDPEWGGFGSEPKFPQPSMVDLVLRAYSRNQGAETLEVITTTLDAMASGGMYDHLGGGFARYSVDRRWLVPHFEKMLYDQAGLVRVYLHGWQVTGNERWLQVVEETVGYVLRDLADPDGAFYSAEDADSEGEEGRFYVWDLAEVEAVAGDDAAEAARWWGVTPGGNFEGRNILHRPERGVLRRPPGVERARQALFSARAGRVRPGLDDKVLTEWNAMFVSALCEAGAAAGRQDWIAAAERAARFLVARLRRPDGRWLRAWQGGRAQHLALAADYAWLVDMFTRLGEATGRAEWLEQASAAATDMVALFADPADGTLFTTATDGEALIVRAKDLFDGAVPSANSVAAVALLRLHALTGDEAAGEAGRRIVDALLPVAAEQPLGFTHLFAAVDLASAGTTEVVVAGDRPDLLDAARRRWLPNGVLAWGERTDSPLWEGRQDGFAYVCRGYTCGLPAADVATLEDQLAS